MGDETRKLLKVFGVAVTDFEAEADKLAGRAAQLSTTTGKEEIISLVADTTELCRELGQRWLEITQHVFAMQDRFLAAVAEAAGRAKS